MTYNGANTFVGSTALADDLGYIILGIVSTIVGGSVTGQRYLAASNGVINTESQGTSIFPGTIAGTTSSGGQYLP